MLNSLTTILEVVGAVVILAAVALGVYTAVPQPWSLAAALAVIGVGLVGLSLIIAPPSVRTRRKAASQ